MSFKLWHISSKEYSNALKFGEFFDTEILVGENPNTKIFKAHSLILKIRSSYFRTEFSKDKIKIENNIIKHKIPNISVKIFDILIKYIYSGTIILYKNDFKTNVELLFAADDLYLNNLCIVIEEYLLKDEALLKQNFVLIQHAANQFTRSQLFQYYKAQDPTLIFKSNDFTTIKEDVLLDLLKKNNHSLRPIEIWDKVIEWGIARFDKLPSDITKWTPSKVTAFGTLIRPFIPHINFKKISPADFCQKIKPLKNIFDKDFYVQTLEYYSMDIMNIDSRIISSDHAFLLGNLIKITRQDNHSVFYDFKLLVRGSRDGFNIQSFHERCDEKGPTITVVCIKNSDEIIGGFNPLFWNSSNEFYRAEHSFIFSLDENVLSNFIYSKAIDKEHAILNRNSSGPIFGKNASDLCLLFKDGGYNRVQCFKNSYEKLIRKNEGVFEIDDYEVFQVIDKST